MTLTEAIATGRPIREVGKDHWWTPDAHGYYQNHHGLSLCLCARWFTVKWEVNNPTVTLTLAQLRLDIAAWDNSRETDQLKFFAKLWGLK